MTDSPSSTTPSSIDNNHPFNSNPFNNNNNSGSNSNSGGIGYHQGSLGRTNLAYNDNDNKSTTAQASSYANQGGPTNYNDSSSKGSVGHQQLLAEGQEKFRRSESPLATNSNNNGVSSNFVNTDGVVYQPQNVKRSNQQASLLTMDSQQQPNVSFFLWLKLHLGFFSWYYLNW